MHLFTIGKKSILVSLVTTKSANLVKNSNSKSVWVLVRFPTMPDSELWIESRNFTARKAVIFSFTFNFISYESDKNSERHKLDKFSSRQ